MGSVYSTIEVTAQNPYFLMEPIQLTGQYRVQTADIDGKNYSYQYRGQKNEESYLDPAAYTKNIPGLDKDLRQVSFPSKKQIFYFYSCNNIDYFKSPLRRMMPKSSEKMIFGTDNEGWWGTKPDAVFIMSIARGVSSSSGIVSELNATHDCENCFIAY
jgi:hypothetical protein